MPVRYAPAAVPSHRRGRAAVAAARAGDEGPGLMRDLSPKVALFRLRDNIVVFVPRHRTVDQGLKLRRRQSALLRHIADQSVP